MMYIPDDQPDRTNRPEPADTAFLDICREVMPTHCDNIRRTVEGFRNEDPTYDGAVLRFACANIRNIAEALLQAVDKAEAECKWHLAVRGDPLFRQHPMTPRQIFGRRRSADAALPATVSPGALA